MEFKPHDYQAYAIQRIIEQPKIGLFLEMGLGKTVITLTAINELMYNSLEVQKVLVIAPLRVAETVWDGEAKKWDHLKHLRFTKILGNARERSQALQKEADIYVINRDNVHWLVNQCGRNWPFDMVVLDELSSFKNPKARRFRALKEVLPCIDRLVGLTGTPAPNGLIDLWPQIYLLDRGQSLGRTMTSYRDNYFVPGKRNGMVVYEWKLRDGAEDAIYKKLDGLVVSMKSKDYIEMPERINNYIRVKIPDVDRELYDILEKTMVLPLGENQDITAQSAAAVCGKLLQLAGGAVYDEHGVWHDIHRAKLDALYDVVDAANGNPVLCYYAFRHEAERIMEEFGGMGARMLETAQDVEDWNAGKIPMLLCHPDSAGHGLNLQAGGHILVWFGLTWSLEKYQQANARLHRQGQRYPVIVNHIVAEDTIDERVLAVLERKERMQDALLDAVKARINKWAEIDSKARESQS